MIRFDRRRVVVLIHTTIQIGSHYLLLDKGHVTGDKETDQTTRQNGRSGILLSRKIGQNQGRRNRRSGNRDIDRPRHAQDTQLYWNEWHGIMNRLSKGGTRRHGGKNAPPLIATSNGKGNGHQFGHANNAGRKRRIHFEMKQSVGRPNVIQRTGRTHGQVRST